MTGTVARLRHTAAGALLAVPTAVVASACLLAGCTVSIAGTAVPDASAVRLQITDAPRTTETPRFDDAAGRFTLVPPAGWTVDTSGAQGTSVVFRDPDPRSSGAGTFSANVHVLVSPADVDLATTVVGARRELSGLADYDPTTDEPVTLADGTPAYLFGGTFTEPRSGFELRNLQLLTVHASSMIVVTGTALLGTWSDYTATFDATLRTLTVTT